ENCLKLWKDQDSAVLANWIKGELNSLINKRELSGTLELEEIIPHKYMINLLGLVYREKLISNLVAKDVLEKAIDLQKDPVDIVTSQGLSQISDIDILEDIINKVLASKEGESA